MDQSYVIPFVRSLQNVFETMLQLPLQIGQPQVRKSQEASSEHEVSDVSGIIGLSGDIEGSVILCLPTATAERLASLFTGTELDCTHEDLADAIGELVNMISGGAKAQFTGKEVSLSCPSVVLGSQHRVLNRRDTMTFEIACGSDVGNFTVEVVLQIPSEEPVANDC